MPSSRLYAQVGLHELLDEVDLTEVLIVGRNDDIEDSDYVLMSNSRQLGSNIPSWAATDAGIEMVVLLLSGPT
jgi:hypothetical protein